MIEKLFNLPQGNFENLKYVLFKYKSELRAKYNKIPTFIFD